MENANVTVGLLLAVLMTATVLFIATLYAANRKVEQYLIDRGATDIDVRPQLFDLAGAVNQIMKNREGFQD